MDCDILPPTVSDAYDRAVPTDSRGVARCLRLHRRVFAFDTLEKVLNGFTDLPLGSRSSWFA